MGRLCSCIQQRTSGPLLVPVLSRRVGSAMRVQLRQVEFDRVRGGAWGVRAWFAKEVRHAGASCAGAHTYEHALVW